MANSQEQQQLLAAYYHAMGVPRVAETSPATDAHFQQQQQQQQQLLVQLQMLQQQMLPYQQHQWNENMFQHMAQFQPPPQQQQQQQQQFQQSQQLQGASIGDPHQRRQQHAVEAHLQPPYHLQGSSQPAAQQAMFDMASSSSSSGVMNQAAVSDDLDFYLPGPTIPGLFIHPAMHPQQQAMPALQGFSLSPPVTALLQPFVGSAPSWPPKVVPSPASSSGVAAFGSFRAEGAAPGERPSSPDNEDDDEEDEAVAAAEGVVPALVPGAALLAPADRQDQHAACRETEAALQSTVGSLLEAQHRQAEAATAAQAGLEEQLAEATKLHAQLLDEQKTSAEQQERLRRQLVDGQQEATRKREQLRSVAQDLRRNLLNAQAALAAAKSEALAAQTQVTSLQEDVAKLHGKLEGARREATECASELTQLKAKLLDKPQPDKSSAAAPAATTTATTTTGAPDADDARGRKQRRKEARRLHLLRQEDDDLDQIVAEATAAAPAAGNPCDGVDLTDGTFAAVGLPRHLIAVLRSNASGSGAAGAGASQDPPKDDSLPFPLSYRQRTEVLRRGLFCLFAVQREATLAWQMHCARLQCRISHLNKQNTRLLETCTRALPRSCFAMGDGAEEDAVGEQGKRPEVDNTADMLQQLMESTEPDLELLDRALFRYSGPVALLYELHQRSEERVAHFRAQLRDAEQLHQTEQSGALLAFKTLCEAALVNPATLDDSSRTTFAEALARADKLPPSCNSRWLDADLQPDQGSFRPQLTAVAQRSADRKREAAAARRAREEMARTVDRKIQQECTTEKLSTILGAHLSLRHAATGLDSEDEAERDDRYDGPTEQVPP